MWTTRSDSLNSISIAIQKLLTLFFTPHIVRFQYSPGKVASVKVLESQRLVESQLFFLINLNITQFKEWRFGKLAKLDSTFVDMLNKAERICYADDFSWESCDTLLALLFLIPNLSF